MDDLVVKIIFASLIVVSVILAYLCFPMTYIENKDLKKRISELEEEGLSQVGMELSDTEYTERLLEFARTFATQRSVLSFNEFIDNHEADKITKTQLSYLVENISNKVHEEINEDHIHYDRMLITKEALDTYIICTIVTSIKSLFEKEVGGY